jgi:tRNA 2-thiouridine synthesizing protein A
MPDNNAEYAHDHYLDAKGLNCPLPVLKAKLELARMQPGKILRVEATDPHATIDFHAYCARTGHQIISLLDTGEIITFYIKRAENGIST